jgi:hypothetical protein
MQLLYKKKNINLKRGIDAVLRGDCYWPVEKEWRKKVLLFEGPLTEL